MVRSRKKGSYILEAAIVLPVFLIAVIVMSSIILMYSCIESCNFSAAGELRRSAAEAVYADTPLLLTHRLRSDFEGEHSQVKSANIRDFGYRVSRWGQDELIAVTYRLDMRTSNPLGLNAKAGCVISLVTRAYVGKIRNVQPMTAGEMSGDDAEPVYIFPKRGEKYHCRGCSFLTAASTTATLTPELRSRYHACPLCGSGSAPNGTLVWYFPAAGEDYHLRGCSALQRNFVEIDKRDAIERGYTPCAKCGG